MDIMFVWKNAYYHPKAPKADQNFINDTLVNLCCYFMNFVIVGEVLP